MGIVEYDTLMYCIVRIIYDVCVSNCIAVNVIYIKVI